MTLTRVARRLGLRIEIVDLGEWGEAGLFAEYDAARRVIRVDAKRMHALRDGARRRFFATAVAHELYHHLESIGAVTRLRTHAEREAAAAAFAREHVA